jgi:hypothetical protein
VIDTIPGCRNRVAVWASRRKRFWSSALDAEHLDDEDLVQEAVADLVDRAHSPLAELPEELELLVQLGQIRRFHLFRAWRMTAAGRPFSRRLR